MKKRLVRKHSKPIMVKAYNVECTNGGGNGKCTPGC